MSAFPHVALLVVQSTVATSTPSSPSNAFPNSSHVGAKRLLHTSKTFLQLSSIKPLLSPCWRSRMRSETTRWAQKNPVSNFLPSCGQSNWKEHNCSTFSSLCACGYWTYLGNKEEQSIRDEGYYIPVTTPGCKKLDKPQGVLLLHLNSNSTYQHVMWKWQKIAAATEKSGKGQSTQSTSTIPNPYVHDRQQRASQDRELLLPECWTTDVWVQ